MISTDTQRTQAEECGPANMSAQEYKPFTVIGKCTRCEGTIAVDCPSLQGARHICKPVPQIRKCVKCKGEMDPRYTVVKTKCDGCWVEDAKL